MTAMRNSKGEREESGDGTGIVILAGSVFWRIVVCRKHDALVSSLAPGNLDPEIAHGLSIDREFLSGDVVADVARSQG